MDNSSESLIPALPSVVAEDSSASERVAAPWNYQRLLLALVISFVLQMLFLPCMCAEGTGKVDFALMFDGYVVLRLLVAWLRNERGRTWVFYSVLLYTSPVWITILISVLAHR
ncbi:MAG TPA: hypothetical protein VGL77_00385 [Armatimonadota bacterium]|jgi:hypothetical protein